MRRRQLVMWLSLLATVSFFISSSVCLALSGSVATEMQLISATPEDGMNLTWSTSSPDMHQSYIYVYNNIDGLTYTFTPPGGAWSSFPAGAILSNATSIVSTGWSSPDTLNTLGSVVGDYTYIKSDSYASYNLDKFFSVNKAGTVNFSINYNLVADLATDIVGDKAYLLTYFSLFVYDPNSKVIYSDYGRAFNITQTFTDGTDWSFSNNQTLDNNVYFNAAGDYQLIIEPLHYLYVERTTTTQPVPEPATMLLLGSGLIGLVGYGRKKFFKK